MSGLSPLTALLIIWAAVTVVLVLLLVYRSIVGMKEDDQLFPELRGSKPGSRAKRSPDQAGSISPLHKGSQPRIRRPACGNFRHLDLSRNART